MLDGPHQADEETGRSERFSPGWALAPMSSKLNGGHLDLASDWVLEWVELFDHEV